MTKSRRTFGGRASALFGKLRPRKRPTSDPNSLLVDQRQGRRDGYHDRWGSYGPPPVQAPPDPGNFS